MLYITHITSFNKKLKLVETEREAFVFAPEMHVDLESTGWGWQGNRPEGNTTSAFISSLTVLMTRLSWGLRELVLTLFKFAFVQVR